MADDIRVRAGFLDHRKTLRLLDRWGAEGVVALLRLWLRTRATDPDGDLGDVTFEELDRLCEAPEGWARTLVDLRWLDLADDERLLVHGWDEHNLWAADEDERNAVAKEMGRRGGIRSGESRRERSTSTNRFSHGKERDWRSGSGSASEKDTPGASEAVRKHDRRTVGPTDQREEVGTTEVGGESARHRGRRSAPLSRDGSRSASRQEEPGEQTDRTEPEQPPRLQRIRRPDEPDPAAWNRDAEPDPDRLAPVGEPVPDELHAQVVGEMSQAVRHLRREVLGKPEPVQARPPLDEAEIERQRQWGIRAQAEYEAERAERARAAAAEHREPDEAGDLEGPRRLGDPAVATPTIADLLERARAAREA